MTNTLIVLAHPSKTSFNRAWSTETELACNRLGDRVLQSDLYAQDFDPAERACHYPDEFQAASYDVMKTQEVASRAGQLPKDVGDEIEKIRMADRIIFHFPLMWFSPPAMLKGWCERVLVNGAMHDTSNRFDRGTCRDKSAFFCVTTGSRETESSHNGKEGDVGMLLWPLAYTLRYLGFSVLQPKIIHGVHGYHKQAAKERLEDRLRQELKDHHETMARYETLPRLQFNADTDFDDKGQLRAEAVSYSHFIRHRS